MCLCVCWYWCVFFCKQKTAYEMRISDWSSDVCSSDLNATNDWGGRARLTLQRGDEIVGPADDVAVAHDDVQRLPARLAFAQRHVERGPQCAGDLFVIERIDEQRFGHLLGGAGEAREDEDAGVFRVLRGDIFIGDQIHAVADRRYQPDLCDAVETAR